MDFLIFPDLSLILGKIINKKRVTKFPKASAIVLYVIYFISSFQFLLKYFKRDSQWEGGGIPALSE